MSDYMVHAWKLSDFSGDLLSACKQRADVSGATPGGFATSLAATATGTSFFITDDSYESEPACKNSGRSLSILTDKISIDDATYNAGQKIEIEYVLTTDDVPAAKFIIGRVADSDFEKDGTDNRLVFSTAPIAAGGTFSFSHIANGPVGPDHTICFARGGLIDTPHGQIPVEELGTGDEVMTRDGGIALVQWVGKRTLTGFELALHPHLRPIRIHKNALGPNKPECDLVVSPQHKILVDDWRAEYFFGEEEVLVPARSLLNDFDVVVDRLQTGVDYYHVLLENHELLSANGQWAESLFPSEEALETLTPSQREEIKMLEPNFFSSISKRYRTTLPTIIHDVASALAA